MFILVISFRLKVVRYYDLRVHSNKTPAFDTSPLFVSTHAINLLKTKIKGIVPRGFGMPLELKLVLRVLMIFKKVYSLAFENNQVESLALR
jgi:hypothetical protein